MTGTVYRSALVLLSGPHPVREPDFTTLAARLIDTGISPRHAHRTVNEVRDHFDDLVDAAVDSGADSRRARRQAAKQFGSLDDFVADMASRRELKTWAFRHPRIAVIVYPLACLAVLPAAPVMVGIAHAPAVLRWGTSLLAAGFVTATIFLVLQLSILLG